MKDFDHHSRKLKDKFLKRGYNQKLVDEQLEKVYKLVRANKEIVKNRIQKSISLILTYR